MRPFVVLAMPLTPELLALCSPPCFETLLAGWFDSWALRRNRSMRANHEHWTRRMPNHAFRHRAEQKPRERTAAMGPDDDEIRFDIGGELNDGMRRIRESDMRGPRDGRSSGTGRSFSRCGQRSLHERLHIARHFDGWLNNGRGGRRARGCRQIRSAHRASDWHHARNRMDHVDVTTFMRPGERHCLGQRERTDFGIVDPDQD